MTDTIKMSILIIICLRKYLSRHDLKLILFMKEYMLNSIQSPNIGYILSMSEIKICELLSILKLVLIFIVFCIILAIIFITHLNRFLLLTLSQRVNQRAVNR